VTPAKKGFNPMHMVFQGIHLGLVFKEELGVCKKRPFEVIGEDFGKAAFFAWPINAPVSIGTGDGVDAGLEKGL
jgi:hypothetical protein